MSNDFKFLFKENNYYEQDGRYVIRDEQETDFEALLDIYRASDLYDFLIEELKNEKVDFDTGMDNKGRISKCKDKVGILSTI